MFLESQMELKLSGTQSLGNWIPKFNQDSACYTSRTTWKKKKKSMFLLVLIFKHLFTMNFLRFLKCTVLSQRFYNLLLKQIYTFAIQTTVNAVLRILTNWYLIVCLHPFFIHDNYSPIFCWKQHQEWVKLFNWMLLLF